MLNLRQFRIKTRMLFIISIVFIGLVTLAVVSLHYEREALYDQQKEKVEKMVQGVISITKYYHGLSVAGEMTEQEAKDTVISILNNFRYDGNNYVWINDDKPNMIMHPFKPDLNGTSVAGVKDPDGVALFIEMVNVAKSKGKGYVPYKWPKPGADAPVDKISYVESFTPWSWIIGTGIYIDNVEDVFAVHRNIIIGISIIILASVVMLIHLIGSSIIRPSREAYLSMQNIAEGDGDLTQPLTTEGNDAIARLGKAFNSFTEKMRESLKDVAQNAQQTLQNAEMVANTSIANKEFIQTQSDNTTQVAAAMEEMTANIQEVSSNADAAEQAAIDAQKNTSAGKAIVSSTIDEIEHLSADIDEVSHKINELATESQNIGAVLDVIRGIAEQTNLLALNAAIEAARAGEQGRGFAVVADEVRTLASRTGQSTDEIQEMITKLQNGAQQAVEAVNNSQKTSKQTVESAAEANDSLSQIDDLMLVISDMNSQIARATEQQTQAANEVNLRIAELADMTGEALNMTEDLSQASVELKSSSDQMNEVVGRFKLG